MNEYDILVVGASTTGCWFAEKMASQGFSVLVIEKEEPENVSGAYDIFHMTQNEMENSDLFIPDESSPVRAFSFNGSPMWSPYGNYPKGKASSNPTIGLHKHDYIMLMADKAKKSGAEIIYGASFVDFIFDKHRKVAGARFETADGEQRVYTKLVADCSGIPSAARTKLPSSSIVGNFRLTNKDLLYVVLYYVEYKDKAFNPREADGFFLQYKSWSAPSGNPNGAILGIGAPLSYSYAEYVFENHFTKNVHFPEYTVEKIERGVTPYHRSVYSFVDNGFIAMGDAACLTKPTCGEGCTSSLVQGKIAVEVISGLLKKGEPLTKENMWSINTRYMKEQGKDFDCLRPLLMGVISPGYDEAEYMFANEIVFAQKILGGMDGGFTLGVKDIALMLKNAFIGVMKKKIRLSSLTKIARGIKEMFIIAAHYDKYPEKPEDFPLWRAKADELWSKCQTVTGTCDKEIIKKLNLE